MQNQGKTKKQFRTLFNNTHSLTTVLDAKLKRFHSEFCELEMLEIFTRAFALKNHYWNMKLSFLAVSSVLRCSP